MQIRIATLNVWGLPAPFTPDGAERMQAIGRQLTAAWDTANCCDPLTIESEVFWRRGAPPKRPDGRVPDSR